MHPGDWMRSNPTAQGYCLSDAERRELAAGLRFSTGLCLSLVVVAFKIATAWLLVVGTLLASGATTAGLVLGGLLVAACATVTATNLCLPSETFAWWARHTQREHSITTEGAQP